MSLIFLKLGGSLITDKNKTNTANTQKIAEISTEIAASLRESPDLQLVIGHGSGSFGHHAARQFGTRDGVHTPEEWTGFAQVWERARALNQIVIENLSKAGLPVFTFSPSSTLLAENHVPQSWNFGPLRSAVEHKLIPVIHGDVVFDTQIGGTILSTEELFIELANHMVPDRILLAGVEPGVWNDYSKKDYIVKSITPALFMNKELQKLQSSSPDVTGGMGSKITSMLSIVQKNPSTIVSIFSGVEPRSIHSILTGSFLGTTITASERGLHDL
jgi:isopentenyl phosphate kinase